MNAAKPKPREKEAKNIAVVEIDMGSQSTKLVIQVAYPDFKETTSLPVAVMPNKTIEE